MVQIKHGLRAFLLLGASTLLGSCLNDQDKEESKLTIGTIQVIEGNDYYFQLDPGSKMYPGDTTHLQNYRLIDGQRAFINFDLLEEKMPGYDYNAVIYHIENILTKDILRMPAEISEEKAGHDRINMTNLWMSEGYLNIQYQFLYNSQSDKKQILNLVLNELPAKDEANTDYLELELRRQGFEETENKLGHGLVSFRLVKISDKLKDKKGIRVRYHSFYDGEQTKQVDFTQ